MSSLDEMELYLRLQIDPRDASNPRYAQIHKQLEAILAAKVQIALGQPVTVVIPARATSTVTGAPDGKV